MTALALIEWNVQPEELDQWDPDRATQVEIYQKVFAFGVDESKVHDKANIKKIIEIFGKDKIFKKNLMAVNHMDAVNLKPRQAGQETLNQKRIKAIEKSNNEFAQFFLKQLHNLTWKDYSKGVLTTIPFDEGLNMLKKATLALYDLQIAAIEDTYSKDLSLSEMKNVIDLHNLNNEYTLGKNLKKK